MLPGKIIPLNTPLARCHVFHNLSSLTLCHSKLKVALGFSLDRYPTTTVLFLLFVNKILVWSFTSVLRPLYTLHMIWGMSEKRILSRILYVIVNWTSVDNIKYFNNVVCRFCYVLWWPRKCSFIMHCLKQKNTRIALIFFKISPQQSNKTNKNIFY